MFTKFRKLPTNGGKFQTEDTRKIQNTDQGKTRQLGHQGKQVMLQLNTKYNKMQLKIKYSARLDKKHARRILHC